MAIDPITLSLIAKAGMGAIQAFKASKIKPERPDNSVTTATKAATAAADQRRQMAERPGASIARENIRQSAADATRAVQQSSKNSGEALVGQAGVFARQQGAMRTQDEMNAQFIDSADQGYIKALQGQATEERRVQDINRMDYQRDTMAKNALIGSSIQNFGNLAEQGANVLQYKDAMAGMPDGTDRASIIQSLVGSGKYTETELADMSIEEILALAKNSQ